MFHFYLIGRSVFSPDFKAQKDLQLAYIRYNVQKSRAFLDFSLSLSCFESISYSLNKRLSYVLGI